MFSANTFSLLALTMRTTRSARRTRRMPQQAALHKLKVAKTMLPWAKLRAVRKELT